MSDTEMSPKGDDESMPLRTGEALFPQATSSELPFMGESNPERGEYSEDEEMVEQEAAPPVSRPSTSTSRVAPQRWVPVSFVITYLRTSIEASKLYLELAVYLPFLLVFVFAFLSGRAIQDNYFAASGMKDRMLTNEFPTTPKQLQQFRLETLAGERLWLEMDLRYFSIANGEDWVGWFEDTLVRTLWDCENPDVSHSPLVPYGQDVHMGALRVRTMRMPADSCSVFADIYPPPADFPRSCYSKHSKSKEFTGQVCNVTNPLTGRPYWEYRTCGVGEGTTISALQGLYHCGGHTLEIPFNLSCSGALQVVQDAMFGCSFMNNWDTRFIVAEWFIYTPQSDAFHGLKFYTEGLAGGRILPQYFIRSFEVYNPAKLTSLVLQVLLFLFTLYYLARIVMDIVFSIRERGLFRGLLSFFKELWNLLEVINIVTLLTVFGIYVVWTMRSLSQTESLKIPMEPAAYPGGLDELMSLYYMQTLANAVNIVLTFMKFLKYVRLNKHLSVLTRTLSASQQSIVGILVLFGFVIIGFGVTGWALFGVNVSEYRSLGVAISSLLRMLAGEMDYEKLRKVNRFLAGAYFWCFVILGLFLLLNFIIAVISEAFATVSGKSYETNMDEAMVRGWQKARATLHPRNLARLWRGICSGNTESVLLSKVVLVLEDHLKEYESKRTGRSQQMKAEAQRLNQTYIESVDNNDEFQMTRAHFDEWVDIETLDLLTPEVIDFAWGDVYNEYGDERKAADTSDKRHMMFVVEAAVRRAIGDDLERVDQLDGTLTVLEDAVGEMLEVLRTRGQ